VGGAEVGRDPLLRKSAAGRLERGADPVPALAHGRGRQAGDREGRQPAGKVDLDGDLVRFEAPLAAAQEPREGHRPRVSAGLLRLTAPRGEIALELGETRLERLELLARALEDGALHVELLAGDEIHALEARSEEHTSELQSRENLVCRL